ncbi:unnamed protein product [Miscanthus lutarioriparius]|uniref:Uncharacterized protein n=1 Tax=Miscanthus lutarioriparius TaxID=422564 RepID=A0A811R7V0_9POAL|nr:unnamed protein product [Miscanthus lutarioriparius]
MAVPNKNQFMHHPKDHGAIGPFLPALPTPLSYCGLLAFVKQSRHPESARHAFYVCQLKHRPPTLDAYLEGCSFYQWIDGDEMFDPSIMFFPSDPWKSVPYLEFVRWVLPPPNLPKITEAEKRGFPSCDFEEYNYGPKSNWPSEYEIAEFEAGIKPWPGTKCKCGVKAREGVVPSELGYGYYYGNAYGGPS